MAIQDKSLSSAEHDWYATRSGMPSNAPLNEHKRAYYVSQGVTGLNKPLTQMEREWLQKLTGVTSQRLPDMWLQAVAGAGKSPSRNINQNRFIYYTQVTANYGNALSVNGTTQYAGRTAITEVTDNFTMSAWVNIPALPSAQAYVMSIGAADGNGIALHITTAGVFRGEYHFVAAIASAATLVTDTWYHLALVRDSGTSQCYVNGVASGSTSASTPNAANSWTTVGARRLADGTPGGHLNGKIDDPRFYERALSAAEVLALYNQTVVSATSLKAHWKLDETSGTNCNDETVNNLDLTTANSPTFVTGIVQTS